MATSFNPRLRTGGDDLDGLVYQILQGFNPRLRTGGDLVLALANRHAIVSIHASAREATSPLYPSNLAGLVFQSTPPHGRRPGKKWQRMVVSISFNPRLRTGGDDFVKVRVRGEFPFQSTPPHGRRPYILTPQ